MALCLTCKAKERLPDYRFCSRECRSVYTRAEYARKAEQIRAKRKAWREANPDRYGTHKQRRNAKRYGLTLAQFDALVAEQMGRCAVCLDDFEGTPYVHHNHQTGEVVALLCLHCNSAEGFVKGDPERAYALARFLEQTEIVVRTGA